MRRPALTFVWIAATLVLLVLPAGCGDKASEAESQASRAFYCSSLPGSRQLSVAVVEGIFASHGLVLGDRFSTKNVTVAQLLAGVPANTPQERAERTKLARGYARNLTAMHRCPLTSFSSKRQIGVDQWTVDVTVYSGSVEAQAFADASARLGKRGTTVKTIPNSTPTIVRIGNVVVSYPDWIASLAQPARKALADLRSHG